MTEALNPDQAFINKLTNIVHVNLLNENFGVKDLSSISGLSRYSLSRRLFSISGKTLNQFIREVRLQKALEMLHSETLTVSEIAYRTGFGSPVYFNRCFHKFFGFSPGKIRKGDLTDSELKKLTKGQMKCYRAGYLRKVLTPTLSAFLVLAIALFILWYYRKSGNTDNIVSPDGKISIAIMPFLNMSGDTTLDIWQDGLQNEMISSLTQAEELRVRQTASTNALIHGRGLNDYSTITIPVAGGLSQKLGTTVFVYGSIKEAGNMVRINAQLINSDTQVIYKVFQIDGKQDSIFNITMSLSKEMMKFLVVTVLQKEFKPFQPLQHAGTNSPEAFRYYTYGMNAFSKLDWVKAQDWFDKALEKDSDFISAKLNLAASYGHQGMIDKAKELTGELYKIRDRMNISDALIVEYFNVQLMLTGEDDQVGKQILKIDDQQPILYHDLGYNCYTKYQYRQSIEYHNKEFDIYKKWQIKPIWVFSYTGFGDAYHKTGQFQKERRLYIKAEKDFPDHPEIIVRKAILARSMGRVREENKFLGRYKALLKEDLKSDADILVNLGIAYYNADFYDRAIEYERQALSYEPENWIGLNALAWFLIDTGKNIDEGLETIARAIELHPGTWEMLDVKGWGLYKQGKYREALDLIQKGWDSRTYYDYETYLHLEAAKKAVAALNYN